MSGNSGHRLSLGQSTAGFTYHPDREIWRCPRDQHLFPVFSDTERGRVIHRAPAATCNACQSKAACTDSNDGREIERNTLSELEYGMKRFHRAVPLTLLVLACVIVWGRVGSHRRTLFKNLVGRDFDSVLRGDSAPLCQVLPEHATFAFVTNRPCLASEIRKPGLNPGRTYRRITCWCLALDIVISLDSISLQKTASNWTSRRKFPS